MCAPRFYAEGLTLWLANPHRAAERLLRSCWVRFKTGTRLYYFNLPLYHELEPRSSGLPMKIHSVIRRGEDGRWTKVSGSDGLVEELEAWQDSEL